MNILLSDGGGIPASGLISVIYRSDLVPVPISLELVVKADDRLQKLLSVSSLLTLPSGAVVTVVKSQVINEQSIKMGRRIAAIHVIAVLAGCEALLSVAPRAIELKGTSFNEVYRALGAKIRIKRDIKLARFVCLKGQSPTAAIAMALQKEAAVMVYQNSGLNVTRLNELFVGDTILFDKSAVQWVENPNLIHHDNTNYLSIDDNGTDILGSARANRTVRYFPRADNRELQNLRRVLITKATINRPLDDRLEAGRLVTVEDKKLAILTAAHRYDSGALGGQAITASKAWLAQIEESRQ